MKRTLITSLAVLGLWLGTGLNFAAAQFILGTAPPRVRPTVSPAINIGAGGAYSYYGYIKPQGDANRNIMGLQQTLDRMNPDGSLQGQTDQQTGALGGLQTGHAATFFNTSHYYPNTPPMGAMGLGGNASFGLGGNAGFGLGGLGQGIGRNYGYGAGGVGTRAFFAGYMNQGFRP